MSELNERQQIASKRILAILATLLLEERPAVWLDVKRNDSICVNCGRATEKYGECHCQNDE